MDKEILDVIDTAVKIGFGAAIAGISTYLLSVKSYQNERLKYHEQDRRDLVKNMATSFEDSMDGTNKAFDIFAVQRRHDVTGQSQHFSAYEKGAFMA